jgi:hypothetical protein
LDGLEDVWVNERPDRGRVAVLAVEDLTDVHGILEHLLDPPKDREIPCLAR